MAYSVVTADDFADLLNELELFAEAQGWTVVWNTGSQIGLNSGNCFAAWGVDETTNPLTVTDSYPDPDVNYQNFQMFGSLGKSFAGHASHYWGLPGSPTVTNQHATRIFCNDFLGPFSEVHFFGDDTYIWVVVRTDADRWTHFGFGNLDKKGMTHPDVAFAVGVYWRWWDAGVVNDYPIKASMEYSQGDFGNRWWCKDGYRNHHLYIPDGVLDPAFGIPDDVVDYRGVTNMPQPSYEGPRGSYSDYGSARLLTHWFWQNQKPVTGGLPLLSVPVLYGDDNVNDSLLCFLGDFPGVRLCNVADVGIGEDIVYGAEIYKAFPLKRRTGTSYDGRASTYSWGMAFKKD